MGSQPNRLHRTARFFQDASPWFYLGALAAPAAALAALASLFPDPIATRFVGPYLWEPLATDSGFNIVNTLALLYVCAVLIGWFFSLMRTYRQEPDLLLTVVVVLFLVWGSMLRVLEDADLFSPYGAANDPCVPGAGTFLQSCFGIVFVTPLLWIWISVLVFLLCRLALGAEQVGDRLGPGAGLRFYTYTLGAFLLLHALVWSLTPSIVRMVPHPAFGALGAAAAFGVAYLANRTRPRFEWRWGALGYVLHLLVITVSLLVAALLHGRPGWDDAAFGVQRPWVLLAVMVVPALPVASFAFVARVLSKGKAKQSPVRARAWLAYLTLLVAAFALVTMTGMRRLADAIGPPADAWMLILLGPVSLALAILATRRGAQAIGSDSLLVALTRPIALLILFAQLADAYMTSLALDVYHATEKHVVPRTLIDLVDSIGLPPPLADHPAALVMIPYKLLVATLVVWLVEVRMVDEKRRVPALFWLMSLAVIAVGLGPALRDALRMALGV